jgi:hypothetical protein
VGLAFVTLFYLLVQIGNSPAAQAEIRGRIQGEAFVNLRSGPGMEHPPRAVLRRGDEITVKGNERGWYLVSLADKKTGYVSREFVDLAESSKTMEIAQAKPVTEVDNGEKREGEKKILANEEKGKGEEQEEEKISAPRKENSPASQSKPWPVVRVLEGREWEVLKWFLAAVCVFILGWICGGNYYLRRDRANRTKLRF